MALRFMRRRRLIIIFYFSGIVAQTQRGAVLDWKGLRAPANHFPPPFLNRDFFPIAHSLSTCHTLPLSVLRTQPHDLT